MQIIQNQYFEQYKSLLKVDLQGALAEIEKMEFSPRNFNFYISVSAISSAKIEGEPLEIDSFVKHKLLNVEYLPELTEKPNDLYQAYVFAKEHRLNFQNVMTAHRLLAAHLLPENQRGVARKTEMLVINHKTGQVEYEAAARKDVEKLLELFFNDVDTLLEHNSFSTEEIFYYTSFIHLTFVNIHPFADGNGRTARLLEKWFLAEKLGERAWLVPSERYYYENSQAYYHNLKQLGLFYEQLEYEKSLEFLLMLPKVVDKQELGTDKMKIKVKKEK